MDLRKTDYFLIGGTLAVIGWEILALLGAWDTITSRIVALSVFQPWIPIWFGIILGHFFPPPWKVLDVGKDGSDIFLILVISATVGYVTGFILFVDDKLAVRISKLVEDSMWIYFFSGYWAGSEFFRRETKE